MKYKVGDKVRVKSWDRLVEEFGMGEYGDIGTKIYFTEGMKEYCGQAMVVKETDDPCYLLNDKERYCWSEEVLEDVDAECETCKYAEYSGMEFPCNKCLNNSNQFNGFEPAINNVSHPPHYNNGKIEVIDYIEDKKLGFHLGNAIKYISRAGKKDKAKTRKDIEKAIWYLKRYLEVE